MMSPRGRPALRPASPGVRIPPTLGASSRLRCHGATSRSRLDICRDGTARPGPQASRLGCNGA
eukprot:13635347-Alexandrium_andersonii.AAC.1